MESFHTPLTSHCPTWSVYRNVSVLYRPANWPDKVLQGQRTNMCALIRFISKRVWFFARIFTVRGVAGVETAIIYYNGPRHCSDGLRPWARRVHGGPGQWRRGLANRRRPGAQVLQVCAGLVTATRTFSHWLYSVTGPTHRQRAPVWQVFAISGFALFYRLSTSRNSSPWSTIWPPVV